MNQTLISSSKVAATLLIAIVVSILFAVSLWFWIDVEPVRNPYLNIEDLPSTQLHSVRDIEAVLERPLFWQTRQRVLVPEKNPAGTDKAAASSFVGVRLLGIILTGDLGTALFEIEGKVKSVRVGEVIQGWKVKEVTAKQVSFVAGAEQTVLSLVHDRPASIQLETAK